VTSGLFPNWDIGGNSERVTVWVNDESMKLGRIGIACLVSTLACTAAVADEATPAKPGKPSAHAAHARAVKSPDEQAAGLQGVKFSDPNAPPIGAATSSKSEFAPAEHSAPKETAPGMSIGLKWHATNEPVDPYDSVRHTSGPDGPGDTLEGGIKLGF
jgi:hypothetical protein